MSEESRKALSHYKGSVSSRFQQALDITSKYAGSENVNPGRVPALFFDILSMFSSPNGAKEVILSSYENGNVEGQVNDAIAITKEYAATPKARPSEIQALMHNLTHLFITGELFKK